MPETLVLKPVHLHTFYCTLFHFLLPTACCHCTMKALSLGKDPNNTLFEIRIWIWFDWLVGEMWLIDFVLWTKANTTIPRKELLTIWGLALRGLIRNVLICFIVRLPISCFLGRWKRKKKKKYYYSCLQTLKNWWTPPGSSRLLQQYQQPSPTTSRAVCRQSGLFTHDF